MSNEFNPISDSTNATRRGSVVGWMSRHPVILAVMGLLLVLSMGVFAFDRNAENRYQKEIREIRARGEPTTAEELIAATPGLPDEENALLRVLQAARDIAGIKITPEQSDLLPWMGTARISRSGTRLTSEQSAALSQYLADIAEPLKALQAAADSGPGSFRPAIATPMIYTTMPQMSEFRHASKALVVALIDAAEAGDDARAGAILVRLLQLNPMLDGKRALIAALVRITTSGMSYDMVERTINLNVLTDASLARVATAVENDDLQSLMCDAFIAERVMFIDTLAWLRANPGNAFAMGIATGSPLYVPGLPSINGIEGLNLFEELIESTRVPNAAALQRNAKVDSRIVNLPWFQAYNRMMFPSLSRTTTLWLRLIAKQRALLAAIACERYRLKHGAWPKTLDTLVPEFFESVPLDPFDEKPIRFARTSEGIKVWSIGNDLIDDGGELAVQKSSAGFGPKDWGWMILDPPLRNRPAESSPTSQPIHP